MNFAVKERPSATIGGGIGYSASQKFVLNANFSDSDFFGGGDFVALNVDAGAYNKVYSFSETNPYRNVDGLSRTHLAELSATRPSSSLETSSLRLEESRARVSPSAIRSPSIQGISAGLSLQHVDLLTFAASSAQQAVHWVQQNGHPYSQRIGLDLHRARRHHHRELDPVLGSRYNTVELTAGWHVRLAQPRPVCRPRHSQRAVTGRYVPPGSDVRYWIGQLPASPATCRSGAASSLSESLQLAYGQALGGTHGMPPYKRFYAGGPDTVRGYTEDTLGPVDTNGNPYGGNMLTVSRPS